MCVGWKAGDRSALKAFHTPRGRAGVSGIAPRPGAYPQGIFADKTKRKVVTVAAASLVVVVVVVVVICLQKPGTSSEPTNSSIFF